MIVLTRGLAGGVDFGGGLVNNYQQEMPQMPVTNDVLIRSRVRDAPTLWAEVAVRNLLSKEVHAWESKGTSIANADDYNVVLPQDARARLEWMLENFCDLWLDACPPTLNLPQFLSDLSAHYSSWFYSALAKYWDTIAEGYQPFDRSLPPPTGYQPFNGMSMSELLTRGHAVGSVPPPVTIPTISPPVSVAPPPVVTTQTTAGGGSVAVRVNMLNRSRPGSPLAVGDVEELQVYGAPNSPVSISATLNGSSLGTTSYGHTDAAGYRTITAQIGPEHVGTWALRVAVGSASADLSTTVFAAGAATGAQGGPGTYVAPPTAPVPLPVGPGAGGPTYTPPGYGPPLPYQAAPAGPAGPAGSAPFAGPAAAADPWYENKILWVAGAAAAFMMLGGRR